MVTWTQPEQAVGSMSQPGQGYQQYLARVTAVPGGSVQRTMRGLNLREDGLLRRDLKKASPKFQSLKNYTYTMMNFPGGPVVGNPPANAGDMDSIPGLGGFYSPLGM